MRTGKSSSATVGVPDEETNATPQPLVVSVYSANPLHFEQEETDPERVAAFDKEAGVGLAGSGAGVVGFGAGIK